MNKKLKLGILLFLIGFVSSSCSKDDVSSIPALTTVKVTEIAQSTATTGGHITNDGGATISARGVCWSTNQTPTISDSKTTNGSGDGGFMSLIKDLSPNTTYYVRAYATNRTGTAYGNALSFMTLKTLVLATLTTTQVTELSQTIAVSGGDISDDGGATVTARGVCWSTNQTPTISDSNTKDGTGTGNFTSNIVGLTPNTTYYLRCYATNSQGTSYGNIVSFKTLKPVIPTLKTIEVTKITETTAVSGGDISDDGGATVTARGVCWSTNETPTISDSKTTDVTSTGNFTSNIAGLKHNTTYYVRAYATNSEGTSYGSSISFTTKEGVEDVEGNVYKIVKIGTQTWMAENLKTTKLRDGESITEEIGFFDWVGLFTPGYCWYDNDADKYKTTYGALYNFFAVNTGKLCPEGWHVPTNAEFTSLNIATGGRLKEAGSKHWGYNTEETNESGFTALPGGARVGYNGAFGFIGKSGLWWSDNVVIWEIETGFKDIKQQPPFLLSEHNGASIRCIKN